MNKTAYMQGYTQGLDKEANLKFYRALAQSLPNMAQEYPEVYRIWQEMEKAGPTKRPFSLPVDLKAIGRWFKHTAGLTPDIDVSANQFRQFVK